MTAMLPLGDAPTIVTDRLRLRAVTIDDVPAIAALADDWDIARRMTRLPHPYSVDDARFYVENIVPQEVAWAITTLGGRTPIGIGGLVPHADGTVELGYWLGRAYWGQGFATEAARAIVGCAFGDLGLSHLLSGCFADNVASHRVLTALGFVETGRSTRACLAEGRDLPFIAMRLAA